MMKNIIIKLVALILFAMLQGCHIGNTSVWINNDIDTNDREQIRKLDEQFFKAVYANDTTGIRAMCSDVFLKATGGYTGNIPAMCHQYFNTDSFCMHGEYKIRYTGIGTGIMTVAIDSGENSCFMHLQNVRDNMYVVMFLPQNRYTQWLISMIYAQYGSKWELVGFQIGHYNIFGKNAPDYFKLASDYYSKGDLVDAYNQVLLGRDCLKPGNSLLQYKSESEMISFFDKVISEKEGKYKMPLTLEKLKSKPRIFKIYPSCINDDGYFPLVCYVSALDIKDSVLVKTENSEIRKEVDSIFTGIRQSNKYIFYHAYSEIPDNNMHNPLHRTYIDTLQN